VGRTFDSCRGRHFLKLDRQLCLAPEVAAAGGTAFRIGRFVCLVGLFLFLSIVKTAGWPEVVV
jgi:hypothetical protein